MTTTDSTTTTARAPGTVPALVRLRIFVAALRLALHALREPLTVRSIIRIGYKHWGRGEREQPNTGLERTPTRSGSGVRSEPSLADDQKGK